MTNNELKIKVDEFLSHQNDILLNNLKSFIDIAILYEDLIPYLKESDFNKIDLKNFPKLDLYTKIDLVKNLFNKYKFPLSNESFEKILNDGTLDFREYHYDSEDVSSEVKHGIGDGSTGVSLGNRFVSVPNSGYITDAVLLAHELGHYIIGIPENTVDHMVGETFAIFSEFLIEDELCSLGYKEEMKYARKLRFKNTLEKNELIPVLANLRLYLTLGDFEYESSKKLYPNLSKEDYEKDLNLVKDYFSRPRKIFLECHLYYTFGCIYAYYMYSKLKEDSSYINTIFKAYTKPYCENLNTFTEVLGINDVKEDLRNTINNYKNELEERLDKSV